jgi:hypothetical protein
MSTFIGFDVLWTVNAEIKLSKWIRGNTRFLNNGNDLPMNNSRLQPQTTVIFEEWSSGMLRRVVLVRTDVSEEHSASFIIVAACVGC